MQRQRGSVRWIWLVVVVAIIVALLFGFEYLGSEQPRKITEIPVIMPDEKAGSQID